MSGENDHGLGWAHIAAAAMAVALIAQSYAPRTVAADDAAAENSGAVETPETSIRGWPPLPQAVARMVIGKYGEPDEFNEHGLLWRENGPWLTTEVTREPRTRRLLVPGRDHLKQTIRYRVPAESVSELKSFDRRIEVDAEGGTLSSQSESESLNFLILNLADEIATQRRSVEDARAFYYKTTGFAESGKASPYLEQFLFVRSAINTAF